MSRSDIRKGLADRLRDGLSGWQSHAYTPRQINPPAAVVIELDEQPSAMASGAYDYTAVVRLLTSGDIEAAQAKLDEAADQAEDVIDADPSLGGTVDDAVWARTRGDSEGLIEMGGSAGFATYAVLDFEVSIVAGG